ncbi:MAG: ribbon-helix-helix domain-containing protein [Austwickia sp.]|nr:ribbon-helix-helix domain-containing protein [Actinomycetota bacterium]MCB1302404.1 CopG family transcriptional regulator [Tetrasphaera sp.]MCO5308841.1 ribbon-helix-helix domain-containing protein [Austwickia sp.]
MSFEIIDHVPGVTDERVAELVAEAEAGYELGELSTTTNPHSQRRALVPADLLEAIDERARRDGQSPADIVREALTAYLHSA